MMMITILNFQVSLRDVVWLLKFMHSIVKDVMPNRKDFIDNIWDSLFKSYRVKERAKRKRKNGV